ncbi:MAG: hypothetical protein AB1631_23335 [Acidobacteriota bacterium]
MMKFVSEMLLLLIAALCAACGEERFDPSEIKPETLREIIQAEQRRNVRESYGELAHECFTDIDLKEFLSEGRAAKIAARLKTSKRFLASVDTVKAMPEIERKRFLNSLRAPLRRTWAEMGRISSEGQTIAGQRAELAIANAIVDLVEALIESGESKD